MAITGSETPSRNSRMVPIGTSAIIDSNGRARRPRGTRSLQVTRIVSRKRGSRSK